MAVVATDKLSGASRGWRRLRTLATFATTVVSQQHHGLMDGLNGGVVIHNTATQEKKDNGQVIVNAKIIVSPSGNTEGPSAAAASVPSVKEHHQEQTDDGYNASKCDCPSNNTSSLGGQPLLSSFCNSTPRLQPPAFGSSVHHHLPQQQQVTQCCGGCASAPPAAGRNCCCCSGSGPFAAMHFNTSVTTKFTATTPQQEPPVMMSPLPQQQAMVQQHNNFIHVANQPQQAAALFQRGITAAAASPVLPAAQQFVLPPAVLTVPARPQSPVNVYNVVFSNRTKKRRPLKQPQQLQTNQFPQLGRSLDSGRRKRGGHARSYASTGSGSRSRSSSYSYDYPSSSRYYV